ncbi:hypothetical protein KDU71_18150 [Carboxylicivirga sediminis]|uniref:Asparagine synthetase domain-containing protein n=1 Tax=Carboxylicivirga sediminis TaxID=2006564 RepID=A0A941F6T3_9BACT|nr:hypothetical protein [Carboxylicivirga sediminis]MBR8537497.1 hypothetical protein [Carboxylicivirga sediminis]
MSRFLLTVKRSGEQKLTPEVVKLISDTIQPDNIKYNNPVLIDSKGVQYAAINPVASLRYSESGICFGGLSHPGDEWDRVGSEFKRGDIVIWRNDQQWLEVLSDPVAVRTLWYYLDDEQFIMSTSQRAISMLLGDFEFNKQAVPWMLQCGSMGPNAWDKRVHYLPGNSVLKLNRLNWSVDIVSDPLKANVIERTEAEQIDMLKETINGAFSNFEYKPEEWQLALSGGYDSRTLLCFLQQFAEPHCLTWGIKEAVNMPANDAFVAKKLADHFNLKHTYYETNVAPEPVDTIFKRFLICGEGRVDHISGYMDGFAIWKRLFENGVHGVIRANQGFGQRHVSSEMDVKRCVGIRLNSELLYTKKFDELNLSEDNLPEWVARKNNETLEVWRDRLYYNFRIPFIHGGLNELKVAYTEVANPWYTYNIVKKAHELPDDSRSQKTMFKKVLHTIGPDIDFAKYPAIEFAHEILHKPQIKDFLIGYLKGIKNSELLSDEFVNYVLSRIDKEKVRPKRFSKRAIAIFVRQHLPAKLVKFLRKVPVTRDLDDYTLAFRMYLLVEMVQILKKDSSLLK